MRVWSDQPHEFGPAIRLWNRCLGISAHSEIAPIDNLCSTNEVLVDSNFLFGQHIHIMLTRAFTRSYNLVREQRTSTHIRDEISNALRRNASVSEVRLWRLHICYCFDAMSKTRIGSVFIYSSRHFLFLVIEHRWL